MKQCDSGPCGLEKLDYSFHDGTVIVTRWDDSASDGCKINLSTVFAGRKVGMREVADRIWLVSVMHYDLGFFDHETGVFRGPVEAALPKSPEWTR